MLRIKRNYYNSGALYFRTASAALMFKQCIHCWPQEYVITLQL